MPVISRSKAWVLADQPNTPNYTPSRNSQYNSSRSINQISRIGVGQYQIDLPGVVLIISARGIVGSARLISPNPSF